MSFQDEKSAGKKDTVRGNGHRNRKAFDERKARAITRQTEYNKLTILQKLEKLNQRLGTGVGATKQRRKLSVAKNSKVANV